MVPMKHVGLSDGEEGVKDKPQYFRNCSLQVCDSCLELGKDFREGVGGTTTKILILWLA